MKLFEERVLPLGVGRNEKCHPNFRMFGTCTTAASHLENMGDGTDLGKKHRKSVIAAGTGGKRLLHPGLWRKNSTNNSCIRILEWNLLVKYS